MKTIELTEQLTQSRNRSGQPRKTWILRMVVGGRVVHFKSWHRQPTAQEVVDFANREVGPADWARAYRAYRVACEHKPQPIRLSLLESGVFG